MRCRQPFGLTERLIVSHPIGFVKFDHDVGGQQFFWYVVPRRTDNPVVSFFPPIPIAAADTAAGDGAGAMEGPGFDSAGGSHYNSFGRHPMETILVVDDSRFSRLKICQTLQESGYSTREAGNGREALESIRHDPPALVLSDLLMPEMDGFSLLEAMRREECSIPVIILTADIQESSRKRAAELGAAAVLNKPPRPDEIVSAVRSALPVQRG